MWWLYLDESGDLGFDFVNKRPSRHFTVCVLATNDRNAFKRIDKAVGKTLARKLQRHRKSHIYELKGRSTSLEVKRYFLKQIEGADFGIYAVTLNKIRLYERLRREKERVYNWIARLVLDKIPVEDAHLTVQLVLDKSKAKPEIAEFNRYVMAQIGSRLDPRVPLDIDHLSSHDDHVLLAVDLFCWGIFRKYERRDLQWYREFEAKVKWESLYLP
ncbi:MAG: DUF3800 domain-containing protein [Candidatus Lindowbacteria bacterium]|nr:DUF3800 domain-containing protein [Candidatus Lindowbacteria bacterium]